MRFTRVVENPGNAFTLKMETKFFAETRENLENVAYSG
jgi:hypothetical protein